MDRILYKESEGSVMEDIKQKLLDLAEQKVKEKLEEEKKKNEKKNKK